MVQTSLKIGDYETWVMVENQKIEHYGIVVNEETKVVTCWIPSTVGKHFGIWMVKGHSRFNCRAQVYLDGSRIRGSKTLSDKNPILKQYIRIGGDSVRRFLFGVLNLTDDESLLSAPYEELGTIKVVIHRITDYKRGSPKSSASVIQVPENVKIHECAKKSATHQAMFGEIQTIPNEARYKSTWNRHEIVATFIFHYRSLDMLKAHGIVPIVDKRKAEVIEEEEEEEEKPVLEVSDTEDEEDKKRQSQLEAELERIRQRLQRKQDKRATKKVKCEPKPVFLSGEIIDLTI